MGTEGRDKREASDLPSKLGAIARVRWAALPEAALAQGRGGAALARVPVAARAQAVDRGGARAQAADRGGAVGQGVGWVAVAVPGGVPVAVRVLAAARTDAGGQDVAAAPAQRARGAPVRGQVPAVVRVPEQDETEQVPGLVQAAATALVWSRGRVQGLAAALAPG